MKNLITKEQLEAYDTKKGTAVVDIQVLPATPENRSYRILGDKTRVFVKDTEMATKEYSDTFIPLIEKAVANGVATLDANGHVPVDQMPTQALIFKGSWDASTGTFPTQDTYTLGDFYIVSTEGTINEVVYRVGDWIIWDGTQWTISRNTNAVASVNGMTGAVMLYASNLPVEEGDNTSTKDYIDSAVDGLNALHIIQQREINTHSESIGNLWTKVNSLNGDTIEATYEGETDTLNTILTKVGKVKTVNNTSPDANGNIQLNLSTTGVKEPNALSNIGTSAGATQQTINSALNNQLASHTWTISNWTLSYS